MTGVVESKTDVSGGEMSRRRPARSFAALEKCRVDPHRAGRTTTNASHAQTLVSYEPGVRQCTLDRFVDICGTIVSRCRICIRWAMQRGKIQLSQIAGCTLACG